MKSIIVIIPHFGTLPPQYNMWRASAICNSNIDFIFFTDCNVEPAKNIIVHKLSFEDFKQMVQSKFDFPIVLDRPYKICDYRPAFAYIFSDYVKGYDFWGWGDLDVVYGDIRHFLTDKVLSRYTMSSGWGHFTLYRNDEYTATFFMKEFNHFVSYKEAFTQQKSMYFDEYNHKGFGDKWRSIHPELCWLEWHFDNISRPKESYHFCSLNRGWKQVIFEHIDNKLYMLHFNHGQLEKKESLYAHFQHRKYMKDRVTNYKHFLVTPNAIIDYPKFFITLQLLIWYILHIHH